MHKYPTDKLSINEAAQLRALMILHGVDEAKRLVGLCDRETLVKAAFGEPVSRLTARVIRSSLSNGANNAST